MAIFSQHCIFTQLKLNDVTCPCPLNISLLWVYTDSHRQRIINWINAAGGTSSAFDVTTKVLQGLIFLFMKFKSLKEIVPLANCFHMLEGDKFYRKFIPVTNLNTKVRFTHSNLDVFMINQQGILHSALHGEFWRLIDPQGKPPGVMGWWPSRAVTFLENHDTGSTQVQIIYLVN